MSAKKDKTIEVSRPSTVEKKMNNKWMLVGAAFIIFILFMVISSQPKKTEVVKRRDNVQQSITLGDFKEADWVARAQAEVREANAKAAAIKAENEGIKTAINDSTGAVAQMQAELARLRKDLDEEKNRKNDTEARIAELASRPIQQAPRVSEDGEDDFTPPPVPRDARYEETLGEQGDREPRASSSPKSVDAIVVVTQRANDGNTAQARVAYKKNAYSGFLPGGSFAEGVMLYGVDAGTSDTTKSNPMPVMMRIGSDAITPGDSKFKLMACAAIGEAYGDLSSERAYVRVNRISCLDAKEKIVLETAVNGVVIDSDGTIGLRGEVIRRNGQIIAKAMIAGIAEGLSSIGRSAAEASARSITSPIGQGGGTQTTSTNLDPQLLAQAGGFGGISNASQQISDLYLKEAASIFPVVAIPPGRKVTISFTKGTQLAWERIEGAYRKEVTPEQR